MYQGCSAARVGDDLETQLEAMIDEIDEQDAAPGNKRKASEAFEEEPKTTEDAKALELRRLKEMEARVHRVDVLSLHRNNSPPLVLGLDTKAEQEALLRQKQEAEACVPAL